MFWTISFVLGLPLAQDLNEQAERLYTNAGTFMAAGKYSEALADLQKIVDSYHTTNWADKALLEIGGYYLNVKNEPLTALQYFTKIQDNYPASESAPAAYYWKAFILDASASGRSDLENATADLIRMLNLYSDHDWEDGALFLLSRLGARLREYPQCLNHAQRLEFGFPGSRFVPAALLLSSRVAYLSGRDQEASLTLGRLQTRYSDSPEAETAASYMAILNRFSGPELSYQLDRNFPGSVPKKYKNPVRVGIAADGLVGILDGSGVHFATTGTPPTLRLNDPDSVTGFCVSPQGELLIVAEDRISRLDGRPVFSSLRVSGEGLRDISHAAIDHYNRVYVLDSDLKDVAVFDRNGSFLKLLQVPKATAVRVFEDSAWVLSGDGASIIEFGPQLERIGAVSSGLVNAEDFTLDPYGNIYALFDKGYKVAVFDHQKNVRAQLNLKAGSYPLKQADAIAVDQTGAIYLVDRRGGSVFRFH
ncbi:MAG: outer membrane protein assembly factor BamD [Acidobacteria bacterium]|nr:outer membrane protein assembly factor BamD [Acidobacteriota bacterium]